MVDYTFVRKVLMESSPGIINKLHEILPTFAELKIPQYELLKILL